MFTRRGRRPVRASLAAAASAALVFGLGACTPGDGDLRVEYVEQAPASRVIPGGDAASAALALSGALFESSDVVVIATEDDAEALAAVSSQLGLPLLVGTGEDVREEVERLGAGTLVTAEGTDVSALGDGIDVVEIDPSDDGAADDIPSVSTGEAPQGVSLLTDPEQDDPAQPVAQADVEAAGGSVVEMPGGDPRRSSKSVEGAKEAAGDDPSTGLLALGDSFGTDGSLIGDVETAVTAPELPGGGQEVFPGRRMVAAYGSPGVPSLGILGEQPLPETIDRVQQLASDYEGLTDEPVVPAFEIITTLASSQPGSDGNYSTELDPEMLREWVDEAGKEGIYVVLDLQPGTTDFLTQAKQYEDLLKEPHVGLALDSEWRLEPGQKHLEQIGSVSAEEVDETAQWLADLTADNDLPQKLLILHQFRTSMIRDRQDIDTSRPELAITVHADGAGATQDKMNTWNALKKDLPDGMFLAWKNFYDEDAPMLTPEQTYEVEPRPWFVSYQ